jgi:hypothetical protein
MVEAKAAARESAARLFAEAVAFFQRLRDEVTPLSSIGPSWPDLDVLS